MKRFPKLIPYGVGKNYPMAFFPAKGASILTLSWANNWYYMGYQFTRPSNSSYDEDETTPYEGDQVSVLWKSNVPQVIKLRYREAQTFHLANDANEVFYMQEDTFKEYLRQATCLGGVFTDTFMWERRANRCFLAPVFLSTSDNTEE